MAQYKYAFGTATAAAGGANAAVTSGSNAVNNAGASFLSDFAVGDPIRIGGQWQSILTVDSNIQLHTVNNWSITTTDTAYKLVATSLDPTLGLKAPKGTFVPYSKQIPLGDGTVRGAGWKTAEWRWGFITQAQRTTLRTYLSIPSTEAFILHRVYELADIYQWFDAIGIWPQEEDRETTRRLAFTIKWQNMVQLSTYTS
jgi:hypothetical protein